MKPTEQIKIIASIAFEADVLTKSRDYAAEQKIPFSKLCNTALAEFIAKSAFPPFTNKPYALTIIAIAPLFMILLFTVYLPFIRFFFA